jgi:hypothetical protein
MRDKKGSSGSGAIALLLFFTSIHRKILQNGQFFDALFS